MFNFYTCILNQSAHGCHNVVSIQNICATYRMNVSLMHPSFKSELWNIAAELGLLQNDRFAGSLMKFQPVVNMIVLKVKVNCPCA